MGGEQESVSKKVLCMRESGGGCKEEFDRKWWVFEKERERGGKKRNRSTGKWCVREERWGEVQKSV